jgi:signal transduction histidine kinase/CheY-like chemotaxis protein
VPLRRDGRPIGVLHVGWPRPRTFTRDEVGVLSLAADRVVLALEQTRLYEAEQRARAEAEAASLAKDQFLAMLAHELRNPLASIRTAAHVIRLKGVDDTKIREAQAVVERQTNHLARILDDLLDVSRITRGKIELHRSPTALQPIVADAVETARPLLEGRQHTLSVSLPSEPVLVDADPTRLSQALGNLLTNAAKYTRPEGRIAVTAAVEGAEVVIRVADTGVGISAELLPRVFDLFMQADLSLARSQGGLGIGLTLVRNLVELHEGTVTAHSEGIDRGSEFVVRLPVAAQERETASEGGGPVAGGRGRHVLVVEDNEDAREMLRAALELDGHRVQVAATGTSGLARALSRRFDVAIIDIGLPGMDGYALARRLRQAGARCPYLIAVTGYGQPDDRRRALEAGFDTHLVKPVDARELSQMIATTGQDTGNGTPVP